MGARLMAIVAEGDIGDRVYLESHSSHEHESIAWKCEA